MRIMATRLVPGVHVYVTLLICLRGPAANFVSKTLPSGITGSALVSLDISTQPSTKTTSVSGIACESPPNMAQYAATSSLGTSSPQLSIHSQAINEEMKDIINLQIFVPELQMQKCLTVSLDELVWDIKRKLFASLPQQLPQSFNFGLFLPPCDGRAGKFLLEDRPLRDYPFHDCVPYVELKYKKRVYKMLKLDEKALKQVHSKGNLKKFMEYVLSRNSEKVEKLCANGLDPNFHDSQGETPLTLAAGVARNEKVLMALIGGGAHIDFRNSEGQTGMHKAAFLSIVDNVRTLLELGASPNYRDPIGLTPLYYSMLTTDSQDSVAQMLLAEAAEIGVTDMHGNHELHQACKNGLVKHVEHLLYYGAMLNAQNVNGNTPLHVCAVNNRPDCARVLLFRGADPLIMNKQGQTALHVANIVGNHGVAEVIQIHNPHNSVPYRGTPKYSTRRRLGSQIVRRRSLSQSSICSGRSEQFYQTPQQVRHAAPSMPSPSPSRMSASQASDYGTLRRYPADAVQNPVPGFETNVPRILVIPRGPKGFGFILRGSKHVDSEIDFRPTLETPALQFFEGVDMSGMAMKAGLRPGDFLLEINGVDVRSASHEQVVQLIHQSLDTITLKVITVNPAIGQPTYSSSGTMPIRRNNSVPRNHGLPPMPPQRHPSTSLTYAPSHTMGYSMDQHPVSIYDSSRNGTIRLSKESADSIISDQIRCASVKSRPSASRRISAAELEHLMIRQCSSSSQFQPIPYEQDLYGQTTPKKFTSVADMKRSKQRGLPSPSLNNGLPRTNSMTEDDNIHIPSGLKSFNSSPDLKKNLYEPQNGYNLIRNQNTAFSDYQSMNGQNLGMLRPKTPPPPPPPIDLQHQTAQSQSFQNNHIEQSKPSTSAKAAPPPPPPPPPPDFLKTGIPKSSSSVTASPKPTGGMAGIVAAMQNVKLKPVNNNTIEAHQNEEGDNKAKSTSDFQSDLRSALAKRRSKVSDDDNFEEHNVKQSNQLGNNGLNYGSLSLRESVRENVQVQSKNLEKQHSPPGFVNKKDSGYTSSRTSLEPSECGDDQTLVNSRVSTTTIRISENGGPELLTHNSRVTLISQHLEDRISKENNPMTQDTISIASSISNFSNSSSSVQANKLRDSAYTLSPNHIPPADYDDCSDQDSCSAPSSSSNDSGHPITESLNPVFAQKDLSIWTCTDVVDWLHSLGLKEYMVPFSKQRISGQDLIRFDRSKFTQLGVTRISHRQTMEQSLRLHSKQDI
ncbi:unnamed protein product [Bursaphelenchus xylophilus]|uniref:(pine wood nematode) hypothetical protein n=1 Tax=Bursaphelenchus xylophilus TaxID=6326 RepID=A0A7I8WR56_BURXY|nr:unnamed protein product [Bursaphelenchus xylophilus]CAG9097264.1 unnamed protein product [Bursaphelenchus xylophilus]